MSDRDSQVNHSRQDLLQQIEGDILSSGGVQKQSEYHEDSYQEDSKMSDGQPFNPLQNQQQQEPNKNEKMSQSRTTKNQNITEEDQILINPLMNSGSRNEEQQQFPELQDVTIHTQNSLEKKSQKKTGRVYPLNTNEEEGHSLIQMEVKHKKSSSSTPYQNQNIIDQVPKSQGYRSPSSGSSPIKGQSEKGRIKKNLLTGQSATVLLKQMTDKDITEIIHHNIEKRPQLGNLSLVDTKNMSTNSIRSMILQNKIISDLKKIKQAKFNEKDLDSDDDDDDPYDIEDFNPGAKNQDQNKNIFRRNYGIEVQYPGFYILDSKVYPGDQDWTVRVVKFVAPNKDAQQYRTFTTQNPPDLNQEIELDAGEIEGIQETFYEEKDYQRINPKYYNPHSCVIQLIQNKKTHISMILEVEYKFDHKVEVQFSSDGKYMMLFARKQYEITIYKVKDLQKTIEDIPFEKTVFRKYKHKDLLKINGKCAFDSNGRYVAVYSDYQVMIFDFTVTESKNVIEYDINREEFEEILDIQIDSFQDGTYRCDVACKKKNETSVAIWTLNTLHTRSNGKNLINLPIYDIDQKRQIFYIVKANESQYAELLVRISKTFNKAVLAYGKDSYELSEKNGEYTQRMIQWLNKKRISHIKSYGDDFIFVTHKDFDKTYEIRSSKSEDLKIKVPDRNAPGINQRILDFTQSSDLDENGLGSKMVLLTARDSNFFRHELVPRKNEFVITLNTKNICSRSAMWPYICLSDTFNQLWVFCAYDYTIVKRIVLPYSNKNTRIDQIYITNEFDLFVLVNHFRKNELELIQVDLDQPRGFINFQDQRFSLKNVLKYSYEAVENRQVLDLIVRSSSKDQTSVNKKLFVFILHEERLYFWVQGNSNLQLVSKTLSMKIRQLNQEEFIYNKYYEKECDRARYQSIIKVMMRFSTFIETDLFEEKAPIGSIIKAMTVDFQANKIIVLHSVKMQGESKKLIVYDINDGKRIGISWIKDPEIVGRFTANQFTLMDGHMYFNNQVFKLRYDLMLQQKSDFIDEAHFIDKYSNILDLQKGEQVLAKMPKLSLNCHKQFYITNNQKFKKPYTIIVLPYLHERKLYLNKMKPQNKYFYSIFESEVEQGKNTVHMIVMDVTVNKIFVYSEGGLLVQRYEFDHITEKFGKPIAVSANGKVFLLQNDCKKRVTVLEIFQNQHKQFQWKYIKQVDVQKSLNEFIEDYINVTSGTEEHQKALNLRHRLKENYAQFMIESNNTYIFQVNDTHDVVVEISNLIDQELQKQTERLIPEHERNTVNQILQMKQEEYKLFHQKQMSTSQQHKIDQCLLLKLIAQKMAMLSLDTQEILSGKILSNSQLFSLKNCLDNMHGSIIYVQQGELNKVENESIGLMMMGTNGVESQSQFMGSPQGNKELEQSQVSLRQSFRKFQSIPSSDRGQSKKIMDKLHQQKLIFSKDSEYFDESYKIGNFTLSEKQVIFWNHYQSWRVNFEEKEIIGSQIKTFSLQVDKNNQDSFIKQVIVGPQQFNNPNFKQTLYFCIRQSKQTDSMLLWDIATDCEITCFDTSHNSRIIYDSTGKSYIIDGDHVIVGEQGVKLKSYTFDNIQQQSQLAFPLNRGCHFDPENHNFMLINEYISLSFSFMTLVIRDKHQDIEEDEKADNYQLDLEMFRFNINRKTFLTCDNFVTLQYEKLEQSLKFLALRDKDLLELLHYYYLENTSDEGEVNQPFSYGNEQIVKKITPLHLAMSNNMSVNIILNFMALVDYNASDSFKDIFHECVEKSKFINYIDQLPFQTKEMKTKSMLSIPQAYSDKIICVESSSLSFVDNFYYKEQLHEDVKNPNNTNYPIKMQALRVDWIIGEQEGKKFLEAIRDSDSDQLFESPTIIVVIEFLYFKYRTSVLKTSLPFYIIQLLLYYISILINIPDKIEDRKWYTAIPLGADYLNILSVMYTLTMIIQNTRHQGWSIMKSIWVYFDLTYFFVLMLISISRILDQNTEEGVTPILAEDQIKILQAYLCLTIFGRLLYYLQIIDEIAPLINIIFTIFKDIKWFMVIFLIMIFAFSSSFQLLAQNQFDDDDDFKDDSIENAPDYLLTLDAFTHVYRLALGDFQNDMYSAGKGNYKNTLMFFWFIASFLLQIHLCNMLIAIMGETFATNNEIKHIQSLRAHIAFVLENWWRDPIEDKERIKYLIMAFSKADEVEETELLLDLQKNQDQLEQLIMDKFEDLNQKMNSTTANLMHSMEHLSKSQYNQYQDVHEELNSQNN